MAFKFSNRWNNIIYLWSSGYLDTLPDSFRNRISSKSFKIKLSLILKDFSADFLRLFKSDVIPQNKVWFLALTQNNYDALKKIKQGVPNSIFISFFRFRSNINNETYYFNLRLRFLYDLIYPIMLFFYALGNKKKALNYFDLLVTVNGSYEECLRLLKKAQPQAIIFSNDHLVIARALLLAANNLGIKTHYVQHASVSEYFPPLEFTYALLEGQDAYDKYLRCGNITSQVHLVGMSKFDDFYDQINTNNTLKTLGLAFNLSDDLAIVSGTLSSIHKKFPNLKIILRPHPGELRDLSNFSGYIISDSKKENSFEFLKKIDVLITGDSSIHLEATLLNVYSIYYVLSTRNVFDYYSFVKNGLITHCEDFNQLESQIEQLIVSKKNIQKRATYYNAAIGENFCGKSTQKIIEIISTSL
ncbi:hypothetical protein [Arenibacter sp. ARW7G5Y1]|uniref:hypothetical protein n=1 Tax=Arenibacter sp. ARW7G5Y1 TaxID=2135619 RepID=UPI000D76F7B9|nr:hypothetical protein [Arenibacter sp. ARW7G5Y1]PXX27824.1 hypothetical protein C7972_106174 [Arenibacter sp. ARW7G5Y1]|tara:strand:+ start:15248 stop:16492 length:1245 start_codon:yes stop_codon:yes gene_type:complete